MNLLRRYQLWHASRVDQYLHRAFLVEDTRLLVEDDEWYPTYVGTRSWCDGVSRPCLLCSNAQTGETCCCACRHTDRPVRMPT